MLIAFLGLLGVWVVVKIIARTLAPKKLPQETRRKK
jgi:hypothetical protein